MKRIAVLASGRGSNLEAILEAEARGEIAGRVTIVISDRTDALALKKAEKAGVKAFFLDPQEHGTRESYDQALIDMLRSAQIDLVVLAGFMRLLSPLFVQAFPLKILNIHPSLLPAFPGTDGVEQAFAYGVKVTG